MPFWNKKPKPKPAPAPVPVPTSAPPVQVNVAPQIQLTVHCDEQNNNRVSKTSKSSNKSTPKNSPRSSPKTSPALERRSAGFGTSLSTEALNNLQTQISSRSSGSRHNSPRHSVTNGGSHGRSSRPRTLQVPGAPEGSRQSSFEDQSAGPDFDSGIGSLVTSEDESIYRERLRAQSGSGAAGGSARGSTSSTASSTDRGARGSSQSVHQLTQNADHLRRLSASSLAHCLENAKQLFETRWALALEAERNPNLPPITTKSDFYKHQRIGNGCYGDILLVQHKTSAQFHAMKVCSKQAAQRRNQLEQLKYERRILASISFPFVTTLKYYFEDSLHTYTVMEFVAGGDMFYHLRKQKYFPEAQVRFYAAQIVLTLEYLHEIGLLYRDLKPENVLIDVDGYIKLTDFGLSKRIETGRRWTFCGTPEYIAPEIILSRGYSKAVDWWALGILLYEMYVGHPPFQGETPLDIYEAIVNDAQPIRFSRSHPQELKDLTRNLLQVDLTRRYGNLRNGVRDIKGHRWFAKMDWEAVYRKRERPPMVPNVRHAGDARNFPV